MSAPITTSQKRKQEFDKKLKQIEADELKLKNLEHELLRLQVRIATESSPLVEEYCELRFQNLTILKEFLSESNFKKKEKRLIIHLMTDLAVGLQRAGDPRAQDFLDELLSQDEGLEPQEERKERVHTHKFTTPPKNEKMEESKIEIKTLFRQLAKAFHPDKEPEEHLKEEKTNLMKRITAAYENQDLYGLLKLEKEHLGPREFSEDKLELYIKHVNDRLKELKTFEACLKKTGPLAGIYKYIYSIKPTMREYNIQNEISKIEEEVQKEKDLQTILWDRSSLKSFLKS